jgi:Ca2+-transporting ATPase
LTLVGILVLRNPIKDEALSVIGSLNAARIRSVMITGDHALTAISVARQIGMVRGKKQ